MNSAAHESHSMLPEAISNEFLLSRHGQRAPLIPLHRQLLDLALEPFLGLLLELPTLSRT